MLLAECLAPKQAKFVASGSVEVGQPPRSPLWTSLGPAALRFEVAHVPAYIRQVLHKDIVEEDVDNLHERDIVNGELGCECRSFGTYVSSSAAVTVATSPEPPPAFGPTQPDARTPLVDIA